jgi:hypothetical protein
MKRIPAMILRIAVAATALTLAVPLAVFAAETFVLTGRVSSLSGEPVADAEVYLYTGANTRRPADFISAKTDRNGAYRMVVPRASYLAVARVKKGERYGPLMPGDRHSGEPVRVAPDDEPVTTQDFTLADMRELAQKRKKSLEDLAEVAGRVLDAEGKGVTDAYVYARTNRLTLTTPEFFSAWTGREGHYRLLLPPGRYYLGIAREFPPLPDKRQLREVDVPGGNLPVAIDLQNPVE